MPKSILRSFYFKSVKHAVNHANYIDKQSPAFTLDGDADMNAVRREFRSMDKSQFWRQIYSLNEADRVRLGTDREYFKSLLSSERDKLARAYNISPQNLKIVASFHDVPVHPHVHIVMYSTDKREGYIKTHGDGDKHKSMNHATEKFKGCLTNSIFKDDVRHIQWRKASLRDELNASTQQHILKMQKTGYAFDKQSYTMFKELSRELKSLSGKHVYGYLPEPLKDKVDAILTRMVQSDENLNAIYSQYKGTQTELIKSYVDKQSTINKKIDGWESSFYSPRKEKYGKSTPDTKRHNQIIAAADKLGALSNKKENEKPKPDIYRNKNSVQLFQHLICDVAKAITNEENHTASQNYVFNSGFKNRRLRKRTHRLNQEENTYEAER